jgi:hypothetical protein
MNIIEKSCFSVTSVCFFAPLADAFFLSIFTFRSLFFLCDVWCNSFIKLLLVCLGRQSYFRYAKRQGCYPCVSLSFDLYEIA